MSIKSPTASWSSSPSAFVVAFASVRSQRQADRHSQRPDQGRAEGSDHREAALARKSRRCIVDPEIPEEAADHYRDAEISRSRRSSARSSWNVPILRACHTLCAASGRLDLQLPDQGVHARGPGRVQGPLHAGNGDGAGRRGRAAEVERGAVPGQLSPARPIRITSRPTAPTAKLTPRHRARSPAPAGDSFDLGTRPARPRVGPHG